MRKKLKAKICLCGEGGVGKTSLINKFVIDDFSDDYIKTIGAKVTKKNLQVEYPDLDLQVEVSLMIWDIMGQLGFLDILKDAYFHGAHGVLAVTDITSKPSLDNMDRWLLAVREIAGKVPVVLLANKHDLAEYEVLPEGLLRRYAEKTDTDWYYTSAKTGEGVENAFHTVARKVADSVGVHLHTRSW